MAISQGFELATDAQFRELSNFTTPPRAGRITALEGNGQVRVATDDPDGGDVLAWPLNGFTYAVNDVVYLAFAVNNPESALVIGSKGTLPKLAAGALPEAYVPLDGSDALTADWDIGEDRAILLERLRARDDEGLLITDDGGNQAIFVRDNAIVQIGPGTPINDANLRLQLSTGGNDTENNFGINKNGAYEFLFGVRNQRVFVGVNGGAPISATYLRMISTDPLFFMVNNSQVAAMFLSSGNIGLGGTITDTATLAGATLRLVGGNLGVGVSPQGKQHAHDGTGGMMFVTKTGIVGSSQVIIADGAGDVTRAVSGRYVLNDGTSVVANTFTLDQGGTTTFDISVGGSTWRLTLSANGQLSVARTAGSGTAALTLLIIWQ